MANATATFRNFLPTAIAAGFLAFAAAPALAFNSGDVPAPVDQIDMDGPGQSHTNTSGISGFDGNQGNDKNVGNAGGGTGDGGPVEVPE